MTAAPRVLLLGASGMLGGHLCLTLPTHFEVYAPRSRHSPAHTAPGICWLSGSIDAVNLEGVEASIDEARADVIVNCIATRPGARLGGDPIEQIRVNSLFPHELARLSRDYKCRLIHLSTDGVFSGSKGDYSETDQPDASELYGRSKLLGEVVSEGCVTVRTTFVGVFPWRPQGLLDWLIAQRGGSVEGFANYVFSPLSVAALSDAIESIVAAPRFPSGVFHVAGPPVTKYTLLAAIASRLALDVAIRPVDSPRVNRSLNSTRFWSIVGRPMPSIDGMINQICDQVENQRL